ncbi:MAG TPA: DUF1902 domain-containing protein [Terriglobales bacterium]|nr:DUF1902 domain-containing protein [Terriglobales bacterium]
MTGKALRIRVLWDQEAEVWVADSQDVLGLITEAESLDALRKKLAVMIPELLQDNAADLAQPDVLPVEWEVVDQLNLSAIPASR